MANAFLQGVGRVQDTDPEHDPHEESANVREIVQPRKKPQNERDDNIQGDEAKIFHQGFRPAEALYMGDELANLHRIDKLRRSRGPQPALHRIDRGPGVKRRIQFDCFKAARIVREPTTCCEVRRIERATPMPIKPA